MSLVLWFGLQGLTDMPTLINALSMVGRDVDDLSPVEELCYLLLSLDYQRLSQVSSAIINKSNQNRYGIRHHGTGSTCTVFSFSFDFTYILFIIYAYKKIVSFSFVCYNFLVKYHMIAY